KASLISSLGFSTLRTIPNDPMTLRAALNEQLTTFAPSDHCISRLAGDDHASYRILLPEHAKLTLLTIPPNVSSIHSIIQTLVDPGYPSR
ncbi:UNVERIFIED_CONTAM: hypothetical protein NY603_23400, partial [Bacteroidetes bacterium 56_B9]